MIAVATFGLMTLSAPAAWAQNLIDVQDLRRAAEQGNADAQFNLGVRCANGRDVAQDYAQAYMWFNVAASQGDAAASRNRDGVAEKMTARDIAAAQAMTRICIQNDYRDC